MKALRRLLAIFRRRKLEADMAEEMRAHLELQTAANVRAGMPLREAALAARRQFGHVDGFQERARDQRGWRWVDDVLQDVRYAARALRKNSAFTATAVLTLALGIGLNAALFTAFNAIALRPLPVKEPEALVRIFGANTKRHGGSFPNFSYPEYLEYHDGTRALSGLTAFSFSFLPFEDSTATAEPDPLFDVRGPGTVFVENVSTNYLHVLGADFALGRGFLPEEDRAAVVVLSHLFWERRLHADSNILGRALRFGNKRYTVIGVTAPDFAGDQPAPPAGWVPLLSWMPAANVTNRNFTPLRLVGRLLPGVSTEQAKADLDAVAARLALEYPTDDGKLAVRLERGMKFINLPATMETAVALAPIVLGFVLVLVIACSNVANLLLARGITRQAEIGVRLTLGAGRGRIVRQLLTENVLLCALSAVVGLVFAQWTLQLLQPLLISQLPPEWAPESRKWQFLHIVPDYRVAAFTAFLAMVTALAAGLLPALHAARAGFMAAIKNEGTAFGRRVSQSLLRSFLVISQVAVCLTLLSCAGLLVRNMIKLRNTDIGFDPRRVFTVAIAPTAAAPSRPAGGNAFAREALATLRTLPGVTDAAQVYRGPLLSGSGTTTLVKEPGSQEADGSLCEMRYSCVSEGFFETLGVPLLRGRLFTKSEVDANAHLVVLSESAARRLWPAAEAVGQTLAVAASTFASRGEVVPPGTFRECQVIGVVRDVSSNIEDVQHVLLYLPAISGEILVRPQSDSPAMLAGIVRQADLAGLKLQFGKRLSDSLEQQLLPYLGLSVLSGTLGALALLMASIGIFGVMSFAVNQRQREIGIRVALGASAQNVVRFFLKEGSRLIGLGIVFGLLGGISFGLLLGRLVPGVAHAFDLLAFGSVTAILGAIALFACWLPARRATKVDPMMALRCE
jgi:macrolide transport system ATP-binding/permease protein